MEICPNIVRIVVRRRRVHLFSLDDVGSLLKQIYDSVSEIFKFVDEMMAGKRILSPMYAPVIVLMTKT